MQLAMGSRRVGGGGGGGGRREATTADPRIQRGSSSESVHMKPAHRANAISGSCYLQRTSEITHGRTASTGWAKSTPVTAPKQSAAATTSWSPIRDNQRIQGIQTAAPPANRTPARIRYREADELWCNEPELPPLRKPTTSTFAQNRMDELLGILRSDVRSLKSQGKCIAKQIWTLYVTFEEFLHVRHPNYLKKLLFQEPEKPKEGEKSESTCSTQLSQTVPATAGDSYNNNNTSGEGSPIETQPASDPATGRDQLTDVIHSTHIRDCYREDTCNTYTKDAPDYNIEDICDCCENNQYEKGSEQQEHEEFDYYRSLPIYYTDGECRFCLAEELVGSSSDNCNRGGVPVPSTYNVSIGDIYSEGASDSAYTEDLKSNLTPGHSDSVNGDNTNSLIIMPRPRHASPGATSSGYDTDQDYLTWNETRMATSASVMAHHFASVKPQQHKQFRCKNGRVHNMPADGDAFIIKADDLYHENYTSSSENEYPVSRRPIHSIPPRDTKRTSAPGEMQIYNKKDSGRKSHHTKASRKSLGETSRLSHVKKTMKNIITDLENDQDQCKPPHFIKTDGTSPQHRTKAEIVLPVVEKVRGIRYDSPKVENNPSPQPMIPRNPKRENILQWQSRVPDVVVDNLPSNECPDLDSCKREQGLPLTTDPTPVQINKSGSDTLLDIITHLHSPDTSDLDYRTVPEGPTSHLSTPYNPCSTGSLSSDSGMASFATGEYSAEYDVYSWGSPVQAMSKLNISDAAPPRDAATEGEQQEENIYETIPDELVNTDYEDHSQRRSAFTPYVRRSNKRNSISSDTTSHTYASIDANSVTSDYESPKPPALPARNYRRMPSIPPLQLARNQQGPYQQKSRTPSKKQLHLDDIVKASDIVDMSGPHMYTVHDVLESFERLAGELPDEPQVHSTPESKLRPWGKPSLVNYSQEKIVSHGELNVYREIHTPGSFVTGNGPSPSPIYVETPSKVSLSNCSDLEVKNGNSYNRDCYPYMDTSVDAFMTPANRYPRDLQTQTNPMPFSPEHKYMTPHPCSKANGHMTPMVKDCCILRETDNRHCPIGNGFQCLDGSSPSIFELRGTYC